MEQELRDFGLTNKEVKVYLACLHLGTALVQDISRKAGTYRTYTYEILKSLKEKGIVSYVKKSGKQYYKVVEPKRLLTLLKEREDKIKKILPKLQGIYSLTYNQPRIEMYEGKEGIKSIFDDILRENKPILCYTTIKEQMKYMDLALRQFILKRIKQKIPVKVLTDKTVSEYGLEQTNKKEYRELRFLPSNVSLPTATYIYGNKVAMFSLEKAMVGIIIENEEMTKTQKLLFNLLWGVSTHS